MPCESSHNRGTRGDSSFMLGAMASSSEKPPLQMRSIKWWEYVTAGMSERRKQARKPIKNTETTENSRVEWEEVPEQEPAENLKEPVSAPVSKEEVLPQTAELTREKKRLSMTVPLAAGIVAFAVLGFFLVKNRETEPQPVMTEASSETEPETPTLAEEELAAIEFQKKAEEVLGAYNDLGIVNTDGFINMRSAPDANDMTNIIGLLNDKAAFDVVEDQGDWLLVSSGGLTGYIASRYVLRGEEAKDLAYENMMDRAVITAEVLNIRSEPSDGSAENVCGKARRGERYVIKETEGDWALVDCRHVVGTDTPYINLGGGNAEIRLCLDEARNRDMRELALTQFADLVMCNTSGFVNVRKTPDTKSIENVCGKFMNGNGAELLETTEAGGKTWYKIKSGNVTGYVASEYCITGREARDAALEKASLTARINTDHLNVRTGPSTDNAVWTQATSGQSYNVLGQADGWVEIDMDSDDDRAFVSTKDNYVTLTYGLAEAVEYYPAKEAAYKSAQRRNQIVNYACQFVGNPYVWGGTSLTNGCDCSGFVQSVLKHFGVSIERSSQYQAKCGVGIKSDRMRPGDLVFYANSSGTINHVGMYIGNGQIVNAASRRAGIKIYRWNYRTPVAIRNVLGD